MDFAFHQRPSRVTLRNFNWSSFLLLCFGTSTSTDSYSLLGSGPSAAAFHLKIQINGFYLLLEIK